MPLPERGLRKERLQGVTRVGGVALVLCLAVLAATVQRVGRSAPAADAAVRADHLENRHQSLSDFARPDSVPAPEDNAMTDTRVTLGKMLFFEPRLSKPGWIACSTCHNPALSWGDGMPRGIGNDMKQLGRRTPTILNLAWATALFWDGREETLEAQALGPIQAAAEMNLPLDSAVARLALLAEYRHRFEAAYPGEGITAKTIGKALAAFERTVVSGMAPFDRWVAGDSFAISREARAGFDLFTGKANCVKCHSGWRFTDDSFHDIGVAGADSGRAAILPLETMRFAFKTPTLRDVDRRAPYMHAGSEPTLEDVVDLYDRGGRVRRPSLSDEIKPLHLTPTERRAIVAFLKTLTSSDAPVVVPVLPR